MSTADYARHRGCHVQSVQYNLRVGNIKRDPDGWINSEQADRDWAVNVNPLKAASAKRAGTRSGEVRFGRKPKNAAAAPAAPQSGSVEPDQPAAPAPAAAAPPFPDLSPDIQVLGESRATKEKYNALLAKLDYQRKAGQFLNRSEVTSAAFQTMRVLRDLILTAPDRLSAILAAETDPARVHEILLDDLRAALERVATMKTQILAQVDTAAPMDEVA